MGHKHRKKLDEFERETLSGISEIEKDLESSRPQPQPLPNTNTIQGETTAMSTPVVPPTPNPTPETPAASMNQVESDVSSDIAATKAAAADVAVQARAEYDKLSTAAQGRIHQLLNDLEASENVVLGGLHTMFGAKK